MTDPSQQYFLLLCLPSAKKLTYICLRLILLVDETIIRNWDKFELMRWFVG